MREVRCSPDDPLCLLLTMEYQGDEFTGYLLLDYDVFSLAVVGLSEDCRGMTIEAIGNLELPFVFENAAQP